MTRVTGFTPEQVRAVVVRDEMCAMRGTNPACNGRAETANHRLNRGAGGSKLRNGLANACGICHVCNGLIESDPDLAQIARAQGVKLVEGDVPEDVALWSPFFAQWVWLTDDALELSGASNLYMPPDFHIPRVEL